MTTLNAKQSEVSSLNGGRLCICAYRKCYPRITWYFP